MSINMKIDDSLICFLNRPGLKSIVCEGKIIIDMLKEKISDKKK